MATATNCCLAGFCFVSGDVAQGSELFQNVFVYRTFPIAALADPLVVARNPGNLPSTEEISRERLRQDAAVHVTPYWEAQEVERRRPDVEKSRTFELRTGPNGRPPEEEDSRRSFHAPAAVVVMIEPVVSELETVVGNR